MIDVKIKDERPLPVEALQLEPEKFSVEQINAFKEKYQVHDMPTLRELLK